MSRLGRWVSLCLAMLSVPAWSAAPDPDLPTTSAPDYALPADWACRPGAEAPCTADLDAMVVGADGTRQRQAFAAADHPPIDCFYVYPTVSREQSAYSDLAPSPEVMETVRAQAGRLTARCRLFAPLYRQATLAHLRAKMASGDVPNWDGPYRDIEAAWAYYLAHDNHGRGVVLIGHSQGTILLQRLIHDHIDGRPAQSLLVSAFLAGDPVLAVPEGAAQGGTFRHIPICTRADETGCAYAWGSYLSDDAHPARVFGHSPGDGKTAACINPAAPAGGPGALKSYFPKPAFAPADDPAWIETVGQLSATCEADAQGDVLRVTILPNRYAALMREGLQRAVHGGWGLHVFDIALVEGNILDLLDAQSRSWQASHR